jgi:hypothetical protein
LEIRTIHERASQAEEDLKAVEVRRVHHECGWTGREVADCMHQGLCSLLGCLTAWVLVKGVRLLCSSGAAISAVRPSSHAHPTSN